MLKNINCKVPKIYLEKIDEFVKAGLYSSRSEALRIAIRDYLWKAIL